MEDWYKKYAEDIRKNAEELQRMYKESDGKIEGCSSLRYRWIYSDGTESQEYKLGALDASSPT